MMISEFLDNLGGRLAVADKLGIRRTAVNMFLYNDAIPAKHHWPLFKMAQDAGVKISMEDIAAMRERDNVD